MTTSNRPPIYLMITIILGFAALIGLACNLGRSAATAVPEITNTPSQTPAPLTETPEPPPTTGAATAEVVTNAFCRLGPGTVYLDYTAYPVGTVLEIDGRNADSTWWRVQVPNTQQSCWISSILLELSGDLDAVPELPDPPTPAPTATLTPPVVGSPAPPPLNN